MPKSCPISLNQIDETIVRLNAFFITCFVGLFLIIPNKFIFYFLFIDFTIRLSKFSSYSLISNFSKIIKKTFILETRLIDSGAKKWAMYFGLFFILIIIIFNSLDLKIPLYLSVIFFLICSSLEAFFAYCLGCKIYYFYRKISRY